MKSLGLKKRVWVLSAQWARHPIDCTVAGIVNKCHGACCTSSYWPVCATDGEGCHHLGNRGCLLVYAERPITCLLYPFVVKRGRIVLHGRALIACCKKCHGTGPPIINNLKRSFVIMFGKEQYALMVANTARGIDTHVDVPDWVWEQYEIEKTWKEQNHVYQPGDAPRP